MAGKPGLVLIENAGRLYKQAVRRYRGFQAGARERITPVNAVISFCAVMPVRRDCIECNFTAKKARQSQGF